MRADRRRLRGQARAPTYGGGPLQVELELARVHELIFGEDREVVGQKDLDAAECVHGGLDRGVLTGRPSVEHERG